MLRHAAAICLLMAIFVAPAHAQGAPLMPGVTYEKTVQFTPHGAVFEEAGIAHIEMRRKL